MQNKQQQPSRDRVAIIGIGLTLPGGAVDPASFWQLLADQTDATGDIPADRWDIKRFYAPYGSGKPGKMYATRGGFLKGNIAEFDPLFFGISPREASIMDIQQRLLLEVAVKTFQDAGVTDDHYMRSNMGVFIGGFCMDGSVEAASIYNRNWYISQSVTGSTATMLSNRISYIFDLKGPSLTVDTACSSSLVATHYAVESILAGDCETALVGGVNIMTQPEHFMEMCKGKLLSKDGRCFTWDKRANGYARGEGAAMLLLKSLDAATRDGDHIYAVIESTGVNQDGTTKGISLPNPVAQAELIERVLEKAGLRPADIDYVEAHGTGTQAGDKAETSALHQVFGQDRADKLCIGSVKTNIGHLEAAAGVSGLIKAALCLRHGRIPANLHFETPNPDIPFDSMCLKVPTEMLDWPRSGKTKYAGINAFGYGGTNAHVILSEAPGVATPMVAAPGVATPAVAPEPAADAAPLLLPLSAGSKEALKALALQYKTFIEAGSVGLRPFLRRVSVKRNHYERRALIHASSQAELLDRLDCFARDIPAAGIAHIDNPRGADRLVFVYSGMGPQWWGMGQELLAKEPLFRQHIEQYDAIFQKISGWSLLEEMQRGEHDSRVAKTEVAQPCNFAVQAALTELWRSWGITPSAVLGHSVGEVTAAYVSGILSLEEALLVSYHRSRLQGTLAGTGGMLAVGLSERDVQPYLEQHAGQVSVAAVNSPHAVTLAGHAPSLQALAQRFEQEQIFNRALQVEVPYHSPLMGPIEHELQACLRSLAPKPAAIPCYSTVTGQRARPTDFDAAYWWSNVRETVQFAKTIGTLCAEGFGSYLEVGPHPVLANSVKEILAEQGMGGQVYTSLNRKSAEQATLFNSLGMLYAQGYQLNWADMQRGPDLHFPMPVYPWQKQVCENVSPKFLQDKFGEAGHPILYRNLQLPQPSWEVELGDALFPYMKDHRIGGKTVVPGAFYVEAALALNEKFTGQRTGGLKDLSFERILALADEMDEEEKRIISSYDPDERSFTIHSTTTARAEVWAFHARGRFVPLPPLDSSLDILDHVLEDFGAHDIGAFYRTIATSGLQYGPCFQPIRTLMSKDSIVYAEIDNTLTGAADAHYIVPPPVLDSVFQTLFVFGGKYGVPFIPVTIDRLSVHGKISARCKVLGRLLWMSEKCLKADFMLFDENDDPVLEVKGVTCQALAPMGASGEQQDAALYHARWERLVPEAGVRARRGEVFALLSEGPAPAWLERRLAEDNQVIHFDTQAWSGAQLEQLLRERQVDTLVWLPPAIAPLEQALDQALAQCTRLAELLQAVPHSPERPLELLLCSRDACKVQDSDAVTGVAQAVLAGLARTVNTEYPNVRCTLVDFGRADDTELALFHDAILCGAAGVHELALRGGELYHHGLVRRVAEAQVQTQGMVESQPGQRVVADNLGAPGAATPPFEARARMLDAGVPDDQAVEIEVDYMTLSRWDYLNHQMALYPDDPARHYFQYQAGMQCVGAIAQQGAGVVQFAPGQPVVSLYPHGITNYASVPASHVLPLPEPLHHAVLPDLYEVVRARYAFRLLAPARAATLLVKGRWGAFVQTVVSDAEKHGIHTIFVDEEASPAAEAEASRVTGLSYLAGADGAWTHQVSAMAKGIDVFLNQGWQDLGELGMLKPFGMLLDFRSAQVERDHAKVAVPANASYQVIDIDLLYRDHFPMMRECLAGVLDDLAAGTLALPSVPAYRFKDLDAACAELKDGTASAVRIKMKHESVPLPRAAAPDALPADATYVVTGGTRGFGLQCARWLVGKGARHLVLMSRSGVQDAHAAAAVEEMRALGVTVRVGALDIADRQRMQEELAIVAHTMPPVRGVIHSAMVLDDGFMAQMTPARFGKVLTPKVQGAINLHQALDGAGLDGAGLDGAGLDFFLMFSSISSLIGNSGQANYVAANSFLDGFAHYLGSRGVRARTINWGVLSDTGVLAQDAALTKVLEMAGIHGVSNAQAMAAMETVLNEDVSQAGVFRMDWAQWARSNPALAKSGFYRAFRDQDSDGEDRSKLIEILEQIIDIGPEERKAYMQGELAARFAQVFKMSPEAINVHASIIDLGVDSLVAAEISMTLRSQLGVEIPLIDLLSGPSIETLAARILAQIVALIDEVTEEDLADAEQPAGAALEASVME
ncbi:MAG: SDR family NAD(P)-dependent oxidoreductase [Gammaproteobacteria bacterium]